MHFYFRYILVSFDSVTDIFSNPYHADIGCSSLWYQESYSAREKSERLGGSAGSCAGQSGGKSDLIGYMYTCSL